MIDESEIQQRILAQVDAQVRSLAVRIDEFTPTGRPRNVPMYETDIRNAYLGQEKVIKAKGAHELRQKAEAQLKKWAEQEIRGRITAAKDDAKESAAEQTLRAQEAVQSLREILKATLSFNDRIDWCAMLDRSAPPSPPTPAKFEFAGQPAPPHRTFWLWLLPNLWRKRLDGWRNECVRWESTREEAQRTYVSAVEDLRRRHEMVRAEFVARQRQQNDLVARFQAAFEAGEPDAIIEYLRAVFERSVYPDGFYREYEVGYDVASKTAVIDVSLPPQEKLPKTTEVRFDARSKQLKLTQMKAKEHDELYDYAVKQCVLRTVHEVLEAVYTPHVAAVVVNGWVTRVNEATGNEETHCVVSLSASRAEFEKLNLSRIDPTACIKSLKGLIAGPLSQVAPVRPILQLSREDRRFIDSRDVLGELDGASNLAEMPWEDFEQLVRELFSRMFSHEGGDVRVTQASRDGGVDAVAFDPDPIRGGKFVIQAKRYTKVVPVSAVRDLYGTMINEGASRGILVTTAHFGRDAREFSKDKPLTLMDGSNLVYMLEKYGYKVRIDVAGARARKPAGARA